MDTFLKVWAILGPLLAAAGAAIWTRAVQITDRKWNEQREARVRAEALQEKEGERARSDLRERHNELKHAIVEFLAATFDYVRKESEHISNTANQELHRLAIDANSRLTSSCQLVVLMLDNDTGNLAIALSNATTSVIINYNVNPMPPEYEQKLAVYRQARNEFVAAARVYLETHFPMVPQDPTTTLPPPAK